VCHHYVQNVQKLSNNTHRSQSTASMLMTSSAGKPTVSKTMTIVTSPACGIPAAPILAAVAVTLQSNPVTRNLFRQQEQLPNRHSFPKRELYILQLCDEYRRYSFVQCCPVHVDGSSDGNDKPCDTRVQTHFV
jgi:hypothetical protein